MGAAPSRLRGGLPRYGARYVGVADGGRFHHVAGHHRSHGVTVTDGEVRLARQCSRPPPPVRSWTWMLYGPRFSEQTTQAPK